MNKIFYLIFSFLMFSALTSFALERDEFIEQVLSSKEIKVPEVNANYNYQSFDKIPIKLRITNPITTKNDEIVEGQVVDFIVKDDVKYNHKIIIKKGTPVKAIVQTYMTRGMNGIPATIIIGDFDIPQIDRTKLKSIFIKRGQNRTLLVLPIKWILTPIPFAGYSTNLILGGHAYIKKKHNVVVYYYPQWVEKE